MGSEGQGRNGRSGFVVDGRSPTRAPPGVYPKSIKVGDVSTMDLAQADASTFADRRAAPRVRVDFPARLRTPFSDAVGHLCDLSTSGARFQTNHPPKEGTTALIEWEGHEVMCRVVWAKDDMCGLQFDKPLSHLAPEQHEAPPKDSPAGAVVGNIPLGKRRSLLANAERAGGEMPRLTNEQPAPSDSAGGDRSWSVGLPLPKGRGQALDPETMTASELMFFYGAPLAHVVEHQRAQAEEARRIRTTS